MQNTVKLGKLESDQLVGGPEDSDDDLKEIMELIHQGEVENVGQNLPNDLLSRTAERAHSSLPPPKTRNKTSRFKINRGGTPRPTEPTAEDGPSIAVEPPTPVALNVIERGGNIRLEMDQEACSSSPSPIPDTPLTVVERSSPKLPSDDIPFVTECLPPALLLRTLPSSSRAGLELASTSEVVRERIPPSKAQPPVVIDPPPSMIADSTPFTLPKGYNTVFSSTVIDSPHFPPPGGVASMPPMIVDSPDFPPPRGATSIPPMIIESPDFPPPNSVSPIPTSTLINAPPAPLVIDSPPFPVGPKNPGPPRVMASRVAERSPTGGSQQQAEVPGKRVSRFAAERR